MQEIREFRLTKATLSFFWHKENPSLPPEMVHLNHPHFPHENDLAPLRLQQKIQKNSVAKKKKKEEGKSMALITCIKLLITTVLSPLPSLFFITYEEYAYIFYLNSLLYHSLCSSKEKKW